MNGALSNGLPVLVTAGNRIVDAATGAPVLLRGVNRSGLEYSEPLEDGFCAAAGLGEYEIRHIAREWGANIIRLPFNQDWALRGRKGVPAEAYLEDLDRVIRWASRYGAYTLLDLQWLDADQPFGGGRNFVAPLPNHETPRLWRTLAERYREEPAVLFDLFNEPHDPLPDDSRPLPHHDGGYYPLSQRRVTMAEWQPWALRLIREIRSVHPGALIFVSGLDWGFDLRGMPLAEPNLVYSTHIYPTKSRDWEGAFGSLARRAPVFAGEWGGGERDLDWGRRLATYLEQLSIGHAAWSWADRPHLVERYAATPFGELVRQSIRK